MNILVTGDIVLDAHLYGGVKTSATSFSEPGTIYRRQLGGAALTHELVRAAADAMGRVWDDAKRRWEQGNERRVEAGEDELDWPEDLEKERPEPEYGTHLALATDDLENRLPEHLRSYGVWTAQPARRGSKDRVWRIERHFGYGPSRKREKPFAFLLTNEGLPWPALTLIDDGGILFRHGVSKNAWPEMPGEGGHYLLKMSWPLCRGDLWAELIEHVPDRLIVVLGAEDLRREGIQINSRLSWEQCAEHTVSALQNDPIAKQLLPAAHVIVSYRSAGALWVERGLDGEPTEYRLVFDPVAFEYDHERGFDGTAYGFQTCLTAGLAHHLMAHHIKAASSAADPWDDSTKIRAAIERGIPAGLVGRRRLLELGHGQVDTPEPGFPIGALGRTLADSHGGFVTVAVRAQSQNSPRAAWTVLVDSEQPVSGGSTSARPSPVPLRGLGILTARYGPRAVSHVPALRLGKLFTVDRSEIERLRTLAALIRDYDAVKVQRKPLCIGVFGPPGAGKSFGVKALGKALLGEKAPFLEFNLSQFKSPDELIGAFHRVRDAVLEGTTPIAFWDEFDSKSYTWLQYLLAPMQDGAFQQGEITHPIGKSVFVFAGGTSPTLEAFGVPLPKRPDPAELKQLDPEQRDDRLREFRRQERSHRDFQLLKGPDFISRLHGHLNVLGPNPQPGGDVTWPIRRALILRTVVGLREDEELDIDPGLLNALLGVREYRYGARSLERVVKALAYDRAEGPIGRSSLLPRALLEREVDADEFHHLLCERDAFRNQPDLENLAAAVHQSFLDGAERSRLEAEMKQEPAAAWQIHPAIRSVYEELKSDVKASNRAAARRIPDHLALIDFVVVPREEGDGDSWKKPLEAAIEKHLERIAQAEHLGWWAERISSGWTYAKERDNELKRHPLLVDWAQLTPTDQEKDRNSARSIPELLEVAGFKAVPIR